MKRNNNKGFTLAELLIVVAVIAVLVAVAIPTFTNQLEKSRQAVDISNLRGAYAAARLAEIDQAVGSLTFKDIVADDTASGTYKGGLQYWYDPDSGNLKRVSDNDEAPSAKTGKATAKTVVSDTSQLSRIGEVIVYAPKTLAADTEATPAFGVGTVDKGILVAFAKDPSTNGRFILDKITFAGKAGTWEDTNDEVTDSTVPGYSGMTHDVLTNNVAQYGFTATAGTALASASKATSNDIEANTVFGVALDPTFTGGTAPCKFGTVITPSTVTATIDDDGKLTLQGTMPSVTPSYIKIFATDANGLSTRFTIKLAHS